MMKTDSLMNHPVLVVFGIFGLFIGGLLIAEKVSSKDYPQEAWPADITRLEGHRGNPAH